MKKLAFTAAIILCCFTFEMAGAQIHFRIGVNIGLQPAWGPVGYDHADYYYLPDIGVYYDVPAHQYIYFENNVWVHRAYLPVRYRNYDLYHGYKAVINERNPWERHNVYRTRYAGYSGRHDQGVIRDSRDNRYRNHWNSGGGNGNRGRRQDNGNRGNQGRGQDNGNRGNRGGGHGNGNRGHGNGGDKGHGNGGH